MNILRVQCLDDWRDAFQLICVPVRHGKTTWRIKCKWDNSIIQDLNINCNPLDINGAEQSFISILERCQGSTKYRSLSEKIIEYMILVK